MHIQLQVLLQALEDILNFELGLPLTGLEPGETPEDIYDEALEFIARYPRLVRRWKTRNKRLWLKELIDAREDAGL